MIRDELRDKLREIAMRIKKIYPEVDRRIKNFEDFLVEGIDDDNVRRLKTNIIYALETIKSAEKQAILIGMKEHLDAIVDVARAEINEIDELEVDLDKAEKHATKTLIDQIEWLRGTLEVHINQSAKLAA